MRRSWRVLIWLTTTGLSAAAALCAEPSDDELTPAVAFQEAYYRQAAQRDFEGAIDAYWRLYQRSQLPPPMKAKALYYIGLCQELLGREDQALTTYQRLREEFPGQTDWGLRARSRQLRLLQDPAVLMPDDVRVYAEISQPRVQIETLARAEISNPLIAPPHDPVEAFISWLLTETPTCRLAGRAFMDLSRRPTQDVLAVFFGSETGLRQKLEMRFPDHRTIPASEGDRDPNLVEVDAPLGGPQTRRWALAPSFLISSNSPELYRQVKDKMPGLRPPSSRPAPASRPSSGPSATTLPARASFKERVALVRLEPGLSVYFDVQRILADFRGKEPPALTTLKDVFNLETVQDAFLRARVDQGKMSVDLTLRELPEPRANPALAVFRTARLDEELLGYVPGDSELSVCLTYDRAATKFAELVAARDQLREYIGRRFSVDWGRVSDGGSLLDELRRIAADWPPELTAALDEDVFRQSLSFALMRLPVQTVEGRLGLDPAAEVAAWTLVVKPKAGALDLSNLRFFFELFLRHLFNTYGQSRPSWTTSYRQLDGVTVWILSHPAVPLKPAYAEAPDSKALVVGLSQEAVEHVLDSVWAGKTLRKQRNAALSLEEAKDARRSKLVTLAPRLLTTPTALLTTWIGRGAVEEITDLLESSEPATFFTVEDPGQVTLSLRIDLRSVRAVRRLLEAADAPQRRPATASSPAGSASTRP